jgi:LPXTG-motif cell wall-anchored protein
MRNRNVSLAALSALLVLPMAGAFAQNDSRTTTDRMRDTAMSDSVTLLDVSQFKDTLYRLRELFDEMNEHHRLALASTDALVQAKHSEDNRALLSESLGLVDTMTRTYDYNALREQAAQGDDSAFIRMSMWDLRNILQADKLNGREAVVTSEMRETLDEAIRRAENPGFRVSYRPVHISTESITLSDSGVGYTPHTSSAVEETRVQMAQTDRTGYARNTIPPIAERPEVTTTTSTTEVVNTPPTTEETVAQERMGATTLPKTGGDPGSFFLFGSSLIGLGTMLRRRKNG